MPRGTEADIEEALAAYHHDECVQTGRAPAGAFVVHRLTGDKANPFNWRARYDGGQEEGLKAIMAAHAAGWRLYDPS
jgi:hypothetical protein